MGDSILATIKKMLGLEASYTPFDVDVIVFINSALMTLNQLNVGPKNGFSIRDYSATWKDFITNEVNLNAAQEYVYIRVKMMFDPPGNSFVMQAYKERCEEIEQRLVMQSESVEEFDFIPKPDEERFIDVVGE